MESNFIFDIIDSDDVDEVNLLVGEFKIKPNKVFLSPIGPDSMSSILELAKYNGYNFAPDFKRFLWEEE
jgi:hypothetical protein